MLLESVNHRGGGMGAFGVNSKKGCFGRNTKFFRESKDFAGNRETSEIFWETWSNKVKISGILRYFGILSQIFGTILQIFGRTFIHKWFCSNVLWLALPPPPPMCYSTQTSCIYCTSNFVEIPHWKKAINQVWPCKPNQSKTINKSQQNSTWAKTENIFSISLGSSST